MTYRVIQWASGGVGRAAMQAVQAHPDLELVGCWVHAPEKDGVDIGTLLSLPPIGVSATGDVEALGGLCHRDPRLALAPHERRERRSELWQARRDGLGQHGTDRNIDQVVGASAAIAESKASVPRPSVKPARRLVPGATGLTSSTSVSSPRDFSAATTCSRFQRR